MKYLFLFVFLFGCEQNKFEKIKPVIAPPSSGKVEKVKIPAQGTLPDSHPPIGNGQIVKAKTDSSKVLPKNFGQSGALRWTVGSKDWAPQAPSNSMRIAQYQIAGIDGSEPALMAVYQLGGTVETNAARWIGQFSKDGKPVTDAVQKTQKVGTLIVHSVDVSGTYNSGMAGGNRPAKNEQRLLGAIVETPVGLYFFKLIGPKTLVSNHVDTFQALLKSFKSGQ